MMDSVLLSRTSGCSFTHKHKLLGRYSSPIAPPLSPAVLGAGRARNSPMPKIAGRTRKLEN